ncbi:MAG: SAM-dependent methyltransferase [Cryomorphaceae bacterium]|jgi:SAM-dependent methyltransferase
MTKLRKAHWEAVYETKAPNEFSWTQKTPYVSLEFIHDSEIKTDARIIDIGGGDSLMVDHLLSSGFENITVLDISEKSLERAKKRLGKRAKNVKWIVSDITEFKPKEKYDLWHDRAVFHFLTSDKDIETYRSLVNEYVTDTLIIGTFSKDGPLKCSGLEIKQYDQDELTDIFGPKFQRGRGMIVNHETPFKTKQSFMFCKFVASE